MPAEINLANINTELKNLYIESCEFTDEFTGSSATPVKFLNGTPLSKMQAKITCFTYMARTNTMTFDAATKTITFEDDDEVIDLISEGWEAGMSIEIEDSSLNDGTYTISVLTSDTITVLESLNDESSGNVSVFDVTAVTKMDLLFNILPNNLPPSYISPVDSYSTQRFRAEDIIGSSSPVPMIPATESLSWVTSQNVTIEYLGATAHKQYFEINHEFFISPFWLAQMQTNLQGNSLPQQFRDGGALKYIFKLEAYSLTLSTSQYSGSATDLTGTSCWYKQNNQRTAPEYYIDSVIYKDEDGNDIASISLNEDTDVIINLRSRNGKFSNVTNLSEFALDLFICQKIPSSYRDITKTHLENILADRLFFAVGDAPANGEQFGTDYQSLTDVEVEYISTSEVNVKATIIFSGFITNTLRENNADNRQFLIGVTTQDVLTTTADQKDRVCNHVFSNCIYNQDNPNLFEIIDNKVQVYRFPQSGSNFETWIKGNEGDPFVLVVPGRIETALVNGVLPLIQRVGVQIVAKKTGEPDFVLQEKFFDTSNSIVNTRQQINLSQDNGLLYGNTDIMGNPVNFFSQNAVQVTENNSGTMKGLLMKYAFQLRWEYWLQIIAENEHFQYPIYSDIATATERWVELQAVGWSLAAKFVCDVKGYDDYVTTFQSYTTIEAIDSEAPSDVPIWTTLIKYFSEDGMEVNSIIKSGRTKIVFYAIVATSLPSTTSYYGYIIADLQTPQGGILNRRFASTSYNGEPDSPFKAALPDPDANTSYSSDNATLNVYNDYLSLETWYDDSQKWGIQNNELLLYCKIGYPDEETLRAFADNSLHIWSDGDQSIFPN